MTEITIPTDDQSLEKFKKLSEELFHGDDMVTFREAVLALDSLRYRRDTSRLQAIVEKIRSDVENAGGLTEDEIDQLVRETRQKRRLQKNEGSD